MTKDDAYVCTLSNEVLEQSIKELGENPARRNDDIKAIREWLKKNSHLNADPSARSIMTFLRVCKFSLESTKKRMEMFYTVKGAVPEFYGDFDPLEHKIQKVLEAGLVLPLPGGDKQGRRVILQRVGKFDIDEVGMETLIRANNMVYSIVMDEWEDMAVTGLVSIADNAGYRSSFLSYFNPTVLKKSTKLFHECTPMRFKAGHNINSSTIALTAFKMFKPFMKEKMLKRLYFHEKLETLYEEVPREILPNEYGGQAGTLQELTNQWKKHVESRRDWLMQQAKYKADESKRPGPNRDLDAELFGIEGSFRKLNID